VRLETALDVINEVKKEEIYHGGGGRNDFKDQVL
jgi:hypothetical protein